jgi:hypothetical protein
LLRRIFGLKRCEIIDWRKFHAEKLHNLYNLASIMRMIRLRRMRWAWHVMHMKEKINAYRVLVGKSD